MKKTIKIFKIGFLLVGSVLILIAVFFYQDTRTFVANAIETQGVVIDLLMTRSSNSSIKKRIVGDRYLYKPVVAFETQSNNPIEFVSSTASNPPKYSKGDKVPVLYTASNPQQAEINDFFPLWGGVLIFGIIGSVFLIIGFMIILISNLKKGKKEHLLNFGVPVESTFQSVALNASIKINNRNPYQILTQWQNPDTTEIHVFKSENLWYDPTDFITKKKIPVYIERNNPKKYYVDLSFLPEMAE